MCTDDLWCLIILKMTKVVHQRCFCESSSCNTPNAWQYGKIPGSPHYFSMQLVQ